MRIVFDIGGTHMRVARAEGAALSDVMHAATLPEPRDALDALITLVMRVRGDRAVQSIVGGVAGVISSDGVVLSSPNLPAWEGFAIGARLAERFETSVEVRNDADLAGLGEAQYGAGRGARIVAHLRIGTGVGGTRIVDGTIDAHAHGFEPGHQVLDISSGATLESLVGGAALQKKYGAPAESLTRDIFDTLTPVVAVGVWNAIVHWSPDVLVLGGSLVHDTTAFRISDVQEGVKKVCRVIPSLPEIRIATLGDVAGLYGAAALGLSI